MIYRIFEDIANRFPEKIAIETSSGVISYGELNGKANRISHALSNLGIGRQSIVGVYLNASIEYVVAMMGIMKSAAVFMPMSTQYPAKRLGLLLEKTNSSIIITGKHLKDELLLKLNQLDISCKPDSLLFLDESFGFDVVKSSGDTAIINSLDNSENNTSIVSEEEDGCYIITTSGSTGEPKAILGIHKGLSHFIHWEVNKFNLNNQERVSLLSPVTFDVSLRDIFVPLSVGGTLCIPDEETRTNPPKLAKWLRESHITVAHIIPTLFRLITQEVEDLYPSENIFPDLRYALIAGEMLYWDDVARWKKSVGNAVGLVNLYGPSETTLAKLFYRVGNQDVNSHESGSVPLGRPIPDTEVMIINNAEKCPVGTTGEIYLKTDLRSKGYYNAPEMNSLVFVQNPLVTDRRDIVYKTGDLGEFLPDGNVKFIGRVDNQIKLHGVRIEPTEIESVLNQHDQVRQSAVTAIDDSYGNKQLAAYIVPRTNGKPTVESLRHFIELRMPAYLVPAVYVNIEIMPLTHNGKIDRFALPAPPRIRPEMDEIYVAPYTEIQKTLCNIWSQVLNVDKVGIHDNFFYLGGTSLLIVRASEEISKELGIDLPVTKIFEYPKISTLAEHLTGGHNVDSSRSYEDIQERAQKRKTSISRIKQARTQK